MMAIFDNAGLTVDREKISQWLKKDEDADYVDCEDVELAAFLNGFIVFKRGAKEGATVENEKKLTNNIVFRKLKIALNLQSEALLALFERVELPISKHELSAFFRKPDHKNYRLCKDQILRNFLQGLQLTEHASDAS